MGRHSAPGGDRLAELVEPIMVGRYAHNGDVIDLMVDQIRWAPGYQSVWFVADFAESLSTMDHAKLAAICAHVLVRLAREGGSQ